MEFSSKDIEFRLLMVDINNGQQIFFLFLNFSAVPKKLTPGKFAYIWHFQQSTK